MRALTMDELAFVSGGTAGASYTVYGKAGGSWGRSGAFLSSGGGSGLQSNNDSDWEFDLCQTLESIIGGADFAQEAATFGLAAGTAGVAYAALAAIPGATIPFAAAAATAGGAVIAGSGALGIGSLGVEALARIIRSANGCPG